MSIATGTLDEEAANEMLANMQLAAPREAALVELLTGWAKRGRQPSPEPQVSHHRASPTVSFLQSKHALAVQPIPPSSPLLVPAVPMMGQL